MIGSAARSLSLALLGVLAITCALPGCQPIRERRAPERLSAPSWAELPFDRAMRVARISEQKLFKAGAASAVITPPRRKGSYVAGFGPNRTSTGVLDPLEARALYLHDGERGAVLVVLDAAGVSNDWVWHLRGRLSRDPDMPLAVVATHDHHGPDLMGIWGPWFLWAVPIRSGIDPVYLQWLDDRIVKMVDQAIRNARPARVVVAQGEAPARGLCVNERGNPERWDRTVGVIKIEDLDGATISTLVNVGCHPETLWDENTLFSADYPGVLRDRVEDALGGTAIFLPGSLGAMVSADIPRETPFEERVDFMRHLGAELAEIAVEAVKQSPDATGGSKVMYHRQTLSLPLNLPGPRMAVSFGLISRPIKDNRFLTEVNLLELGDTQMVLVPGEVPPEVGEELKQMMSTKHRFVVSTANDELGYLLNLKQCIDPTYQYEMGARFSADLYPEVMRAARKLLSGR